VAVVVECRVGGGGGGGLPTLGIRRRRRGEIIKVAMEEAPVSLSRRMTLWWALARVQEVAGEEGMYGHPQRRRRRMGDSTSALKVAREKAMLY
jgi:hypothetical protein